MAFYKRTDIGLKVTGEAATVPNDPKAKLMYYLDCICSVLKLDDNPDINRLRRYNSYFTLTHADTSVLFSLCLLLKPDVLLNKCIFQNDSLCGDSGNNFFNLEAVQNNLLVAGSVMIAGQNKQVTKIMTYKMTWLHKNWTNPMQILLERQRQESERQEREKQERERQERQRQERQRQERQRQERQRQERQRQEREVEFRRHKKCIVCVIL